MTGKRITYATYVDGDTFLGSSRILVKLIAYPAYLSIQKRFSDEEIHSIPWANVTEPYSLKVDKDLIRRVFSNTAGDLFALMDISVGKDWEWGVGVPYNDDKTQRKQKPIFAIGRERKADKIALRLIEYRDNFFRNLDQASGPDRR